LNGRSGALSKKDTLVKTAARLFAAQGFDATTTIQIAREARITEPLIYYHFKGKEDLFLHILEKGSDGYLSRMKTLGEGGPVQFKRIEKLITLHFDIVRDMPDETYLIASACPARLRDEGDVCARIAETQRKFLTSYLRDCLKKGMASGEFWKVPVEPTVNVLIALINGLIRQRCLRLEQVRGMKKATIEFCRRSLCKP